MIGETYVFLRLEEKDEGARVNTISMRSKESYVGEKCVMVSSFPPYAMRFDDGTVWALNKVEFCPVAEIEKAPKKKKKKKHEVICIETGQKFDSYEDAARFAGAYESTIRNACNKNANRTAGGYHWRRLGNGK